MADAAKPNRDSDRTEQVPLRVVADEFSTPESSARNIERLSARGLSLFFGKRRILTDVTLAVPSGQVTSIIGPTGSGKSSLLRCFNRMNDLIEGARIEGEVLLDGDDIYERHVDVARLRKRVGMILSETVPFPASVFENVAYAPRLGGIRDTEALRESVRRALTKAGLWDEMRNRLDEPALRLSHGQQHRLCVARSLAAEPEVLLLDEPTTSLDPAATARIEDLVFEIKEDYTVVLVTNNIQQAGRISDRTAFIYQGQLVEAGATTDVFTCPQDPRTDDYIRGRFS